MNRDDNGEDLSLLEIFVEMRPVRGKHQRPRGCCDPHTLQAPTVPTQLVHGDARGDLTIGGEDKVAEVGGDHFGGYVKAKNIRERRTDRRLGFNQNGKRKAVVIIRERDGKSMPALFRTEGAILNCIKSRVNAGTTVNADEAAAWNDLHSRFEMKRINRQEAYSLDGASTNWAEEYFSRLRCAEIGHHHHIAGA